jgi:hypothetical protein
MSSRSWHLLSGMEGECPPDKRMGDVRCVDVELVSVEVGHLSPKGRVILERNSRADRRANQPEFGIFSGHRPENGSGEKNGNMFEDVLPEVVMNEDELVIEIWHGGDGDQSDPRRRSNSGHRPPFRHDSKEGQGTQSEQRNS